MGLLALALAILAAYRLRMTPLAVTAAACAAVQALAYVALVIRSRSERPPPRALTALHHVCAALSGFFLFVSFAMGQAR